MPQCPKCKQDRSIEEFVPTKSPFHPKNRSLICMGCLERMVPSDDLPKVDALCRWLDIPFLVDQWTRIQPKAKERTLRQYVKLLRENLSYEGLDWSAVNEKWRAAAAEDQLDSAVPAINDGWRLQMRLRWPSETPRTDDDYRYLENFYNDLCATQNLITATQRDDAKRLAEIGLLATQKIRAGLDAKNEMAIYHNIVKTEGFEPKNARNIGDIDSAGELVAWLEKRGWKPNWHTEPQDSVDFTMKSMQKYLKRLITNESSIGDEVEDRKRQLEIAEKMEAENQEEDDDSIYDEEPNVEYEGVAELDDELIGDEDDCLN